MRPFVPYPCSRKTPPRFKGIDAGEGSQEAVPATTAAFCPVLGCSVSPCGFEPTETGALAVKGGRVAVFLPRRMSLNNYQNLLCVEAERIGSE